MDNNNITTLAELADYHDELTKKRDRIIMWHEARRMDNEVDAEMDVYRERGGNAGIPQRLKTLSTFWSDIIYGEEYQRAVFYNGTDNDRDLFMEWMEGYEGGYWDEETERMATNDDAEGHAWPEAAQFYGAVNVARAAGRLECAEDLLQEDGEFMERLRRARYGRATLVGRVIIVDYTTSN
jgi:hypothetical protein